MKCPYCQHDETKVLETRETGEDITRRRRECLKCAKRFTTYEQVELTNIALVKRDGRRDIFNKQKLLRSLQLACQKRPVSTEKLETITSAIESKLRNMDKKEIPTRKIGEMAMRELKKLDKIAYIRFASVYRDFQDIETFEKEIGKLKVTKEV